MTAIELLKELRNKGVVVLADRDALDVRAPKGALSPAHREQLASNKAELLRLLRDVSEGHAPIGRLERAGAGGGTFAASFAQRRLWFLHQLIPDSPSYNISLPYRLHGELELEALQHALSTLVERHETLRTTFRIEGAEVHQVIAPANVVPLAIDDLSDCAPETRQATLERLIAQQARRSFDLGTGPLFRVHVVRLADDQHVLQLTLHHIIADGWSIPVLLRDLSALYLAHQTGQPSRLPPLPVQYADFSAWQRARMGEAAQAAQLDYWRRRLEHAPALDLPTDRPSAPAPSYVGARDTMRLPADATRALKALAQREGATLYMVLLSAFAVLLQRYTHQDDLVVGSLIANRTRAEIEDLVGCFVNSLVMRVDASGNPTFLELVRRVRRMSLDAYANQELPFERLVEEIRPTRDVHRNPLFQVTFAVQNMAAVETPFAGSGLTVERIVSSSASSRFDLEVHVGEANESLNVAFVYSTDLFDAATVGRMLRHFERVIEGIVANPGQRISELPLLTHAERHELLVEWNDTAVTHRQAARSLQELFEAQVARTPDAVAVSYGAAELTYAGLDARANQLAHHLVGMGVGPDALVGICIDRSLDLLVGLLGILKAGGAYVPLDPAYPSKRIEFMLHDAHARVVITQERLLGQLPAFNGHTLCLDRDWQSIASHPPIAPPRADAPGHLAYVIYTSGSSGTPKGVMIEQGSVVNYVQWLHETFPFGPNDRVLQSTSVNFDISVLELFAPFLGGARIVVAPPGLQRSPADMVTLIAAQEITVLDVVPSLLGALLDEPGLSRCTSLRLVYCGGEVLPPDLPRRLCARLPVEFVNLYGPTEATIDATFYRYSPDRHPAVVPIGRPLDNMRIYILNGEGEPVPIGVSGELFIGGTGTARGYLHREGLTAEKFLPDPFAARPGARMYRTGDRARYLPDGNVEFLGRLDDQVKIRGFRIELGEIEAVLASHPAVRQAVVLAREDTPGNTRLVAYVAFADGADTATEPLAAHLRERLPEYMRPTAYMTLARLPLTPNGKVDRRALPAPGTGQSSGARRRVTAPGNTVEYQLVQIWETLLNVRPVGVTDSFFDLGGHSLLAARMMGEVEQACGRRIPLATLFEDPTIRHLAGAILDRTKELVATPFLALHANGGRRPFFFLHGDYGGGGFYCYALARELGDSQPIYAIHPQGLDGAVRDDSIEAMAESHLLTLRDVQPRGPYLLGGLCNGGVIALEMARRLQQQGERVDLLVVMDAHVRPFGVERPATAIGMENSPEHPVGKIYRRIMRSYAAHPYEGVVTLFGSSDQRCGNVETGWRAVASEVRFHRLPGDHLGLVTRHMRDVGRCLAMCIADATRR